MLAYCRFITLTIVQQTINRATSPLTIIAPCGCFSNTSGNATSAAKKLDKSKFTITVPFAKDHPAQPMHTIMRRIVR